MKALIQAVLGVVLTIGIFAGGYELALKTVPHALVYDPATHKWAPLVLKQNTKIAVAGPFGTEPGVDYKRATVPNEGAVVLILPPSIIEMQKDEDSGPQQQNQSEHERIDHADSMNKVSF